MREDLLRQAMQEMGSRGGKRRLETLTADQRSEIARAAGKKSGEVRASAKKAGAKAKRRTEAA